jgi:hypothetical protein
MKTVEQVVDDILRTAAERAVNQLRSRMNVSQHTADAIRRAVRAMPIDEQNALSDASDASYTRAMHVGRESATALSQG